MRRIFFGLIILALASGGYLAWSQKNKSVSSTRGEVFTYVALGDSYTIGTGVKVIERWPNQLVSTLKADGLDLRLVANPSSSGFTTEDLLRTQLDELERYQPDFVTLLIGVNDLEQNKSVPQFQNDYQVVLDKIRDTSPSSKILAFTLPNYALTPYGKRTAELDPTTQKIHEYNAVIRRVASANDVRIVDIYPVSLLVTEDDDMVAYDGLHPSGRQYALWVDLAAPATRVLLQD